MIDVRPRLACEASHLAHDRGDAGPLPVDEIRADLGHRRLAGNLEEDAHRLDRRHATG
jgi:hypothetical protein